MKKLLCIIGTLDVGGAETFLMKILRNAKRNELSIDFLLFTDRKCAYSDEARKLGAKIHIAPAKSSGLIKSMREISRIVKENNYENVLKVSEFSLGALDLLAAKKGGAKTLMMRSSNAGTTENNVLSIVHRLFRPIANRIINVKMAPSTEAAKYTFGEKAVDNKEIVYIKNGLKLDDYIIDENVTNSLIESLSLQGKFVVAHIGRFSKQKNHHYLLQVFKLIKEKRGNSVLLLFGDGELKEEISLQIKNLGIEEDVMFMGVQNNIPQFLSLMDVIIFPSLFEGMPNVIVEAQAAGVPCVISDKITKEAKLTDLVTFMSIDEEPEKWAEKALNVCKHNSDDCISTMKRQGYDIDDSINVIMTNIWGNENE